MINGLTYRAARQEDLSAIIDLLRDDEFGKIRENGDEQVALHYLQAFEEISKAPHHFLMVVELDRMIVGTCHLLLIPSLTFQGATRMTIEAVRVAKSYRSQGIGQWMIEQAINYGRNNEAKIIQLTTHKDRIQAKSFYEQLNFVASHEGMKLVLAP